MDWLIFILPAFLILVGVALIFLVRYDYRVRRNAEVARTDEERLDARVNARYAAKARQQASWQGMTPVALEDAFDRFETLDVAGNPELTVQVDTAFDDFIHTMSDANRDAPPDADTPPDAKPRPASSE